MKKSKDAKTPPNAKAAGERAASPEAVPETENMEKIRSILFGAQTKQYEQRFLEIEAALKRESSQLRDEMQNSFESLERFFKKEIDALADQIKTEKDERSEKFDELSAKLEQTGKSLEKKIAGVDDRLGRAQRDTQEQILEQSKSLMKEIREKQEKAAAELDQATRTLDANKTDRLALANLLMEVSLRLKDEFELPDIE
jgi:hypothetical protein